MRLLHVESEVMLASAVKLVLKPVGVSGGVTRGLCMRLTLDAPN